MASSVPIHPINRGRPGVELGPRRSGQLPGRWQASSITGEAEHTGTPRRGLRAEKEYSRSWGFLFVFF